MKRTGKWPLVREALEKGYRADRVIARHWQQAVLPSRQRNKAVASRKVFANSYTIEPSPQKSRF